MPTRRRLTLGLGRSKLGMKRSRRGTVTTRAPPAHPSTMSATGASTTQANVSAAVISTVTTMNDATAYARGVPWRRMAFMAVAVRAVTHP